MRASAKVIADWLPRMCAAFTAASVAVQAIDFGCMLIIALAVSSPSGRGTSVKMRLYAKLDLNRLGESAKVNL